MILLLLDRKHVYSLIKNSTSSYIDLLLGLFLVSNIIFISFKSIIRIFQEVYLIQTVTPLKIMLSGDIFFETRCLNEWEWETREKWLANIQKWCAWHKSKFLHICISLVFFLLFFNFRHYVAATLCDESYSCRSLNVRALKKYKLLIIHTIGS